MSRSRSSVALLVALCLGLTAGAAIAGDFDPDDMYGDLTQSQQAPAFDDQAFQQVLQQEFQDFYNPQKHSKPVRRTPRNYRDSYRFIESDFDVFWDTVSFRTREAQGEGAALVTLMFKDVVRFDPAGRRETFSINRFVDTALAGCGSVRRQPSGSGDKGGGGFVGFDGPATSREFKTTGGSLDFDFRLPDQERYPWDERVGPGPGGYPGAYGTPDSGAGDLLFRSAKYRVGGYQGLFDFSRERQELVRDILVRAADESRYQRLFDHRYVAPSQADVYRRIKGLISGTGLPVLTLMPTQRDAVLIYRVVERGDGLGALMYWRPSDNIAQRRSRDISRENVIWAVPKGRGEYEFIDRAELRRDGGKGKSLFRFGSRTTVLIVPNVCQVYEQFANQLVRWDLDQPPPRPGKGDPGYPPPNDRYPPYDQDYPPRWLPDPSPYPDPYPQPYPPSGRPRDERDWGLTFEWLWRGLSDNVRDPFGKPRPSRPPIYIDPPYRTPPFFPPNDPPIYYPMPVPQDPFRFRPPIKNPWVNKPVGSGRGGFVKIGFGFDETGYNQHGYDVNGLDRDGFDPWGYDRDGYGRDGFNPWGYDRGGYNRAGFSLFNRAQDFIRLVMQYHRDPFAFRMEFKIEESGSIVRLLDGSVVWNNSPGGGGGSGNGTTVPAPPVPTPQKPGPQVPEVPEWRDVTIAAKITGIAAPYKIQLDRQNRHHILKDDKRHLIPRNIDVNRDFEMQFQNASKDYVFIQNTPPRK